MKQKIPFEDKVGQLVMYQVSNRRLAVNEKFGIRTLCAKAISISAGVCRDSARTDAGIKLLLASCSYFYTAFALPVSKKLKYFFIMEFMILISNVNAQIPLAGWDFLGKNSTAYNPLSANTSASNVTVGGLTLGSGLNDSNAGDTFGGSQWTGNNANPGNSFLAATNNDFISVTLAANAGYVLNINGISAYNIRRSSAGPNTFLWQYQIGSGSWMDIESAVTISGTSAGGNSQSAINLSGVSSLQGVPSSTTIGFRLLGWGASASSGMTNGSGTAFLNEFQNGDDFIITGSVAKEGAYTTWTGNGSTGVWSNGLVGQFGGNYADDLANIVVFKGTGASVTAAGPPQAGSLYFDSTGYTLAGEVQLGIGTITTNGVISTSVSANITGSGFSGLTKAGTGSLILSGSNSYTGITSISSGTITIGNNTALGSIGNITFSGGTLQYGSDITLDISSRIKNSTSAIIIDTNGNNVNFASAIDMSNAGGLIKNGTGTLVLNGNNLLADSLLVNGGTLSLGAGGTLTINTSNASSIKGTLSGTGNLMKSGSGSLTISNNNSEYSGLTTISSGTLYIGHGNALGTGNLSTTGRVTIASSDATARTIGTNYTSISGSSVTITFGEASGGTGNLTFAGTGNLSLGTGTRTLNVLNTTTFTGALTGGSGGSLTKTGVGTLILAGANSYTGATIINSGTLQIGNGGTTGALSLGSNITVNGALAFNRSDDIVQGTHFSYNPVGGTGSIIQNGTGNLTLNVANTYSGGTTINSGTLIIDNAFAIGSGVLTINGGAINSTSAGTILNNNAQNWNSDFTFIGTNDLNLGTGAVALNATRTLTIKAGNLTIGGTISGSGGLTKNGSGTLTLSGSSAYTGTTTINSGTVRAAVANALGSTSSVVVNNGGSLLVMADDAIGVNTDITLNSTSTTVAGVTFSGNYNGAVGALTLSTDSIIDLGTGSVLLSFSDIVGLTNFSLSVYNWQGTTLWGGTSRNNIDQIYVAANLSTNELAKISFYSGALGSNSFLGNGYQLFGSGFFNNQMIPVPEPGTYATVVTLLLATSSYLLRRKMMPFKLNGKDQQSTV